MTVERLADILDYDGDPSGKTNYQAHLTLKCSIPQPLSDSHSQDIQGGFGKEYLVFCPIADLRDDDLVTIDEKKYRISGLESFEGFGSNEHTELRLRIF